MTTTRPFLPSDRNGRTQREQSLRSLGRAAAAVALGNSDFRTTPDNVLRQRGWSDDRTAVLLTRAPVAPTSTADAIGLTQTAYAYFASLTPLSAAAAVLQRALGVSFDGVASIALPTFAPGIAGFVAEGAAIPVRSFPSSTASIVPHKMACLVELTNELLRSSNAETMIPVVLAESAAAGLDAVLFDSQPATAIRPAGLLHNVTALTPATVGTSKDQLMADDAIALAGAVSGFSGELVFVTAPPQAIALNLRSLRTFAYSVYPSAALANGTVIAINLSALVAALGPVRIEARDAAVVVEFDPGQEIVTSGGGVGAPIRSSYQTDSRILRLLQEVSWALRASGGVAWMSGVGW
jgi:hypothetical protein